MNNLLETSIAIALVILSLAYPPSAYVIWPTFFVWAVFKIPSTKK